MMKRSPSTAQRETQSGSSGLWRRHSDEMNPQYHNATIENTKEKQKKNKADRWKEWIQDTIEKSYILRSDYSLFWLAGLIVFRDH